MFGLFNPKRTTPPPAGDEPARYRWSIDVNHTDHGKPIYGVRRAEWEFFCGEWRWSYASLIGLFDSEDAAKAFITAHMHLPAHLIATPLPDVSVTAEPINE